MSEVRIKLIKAGVGSPGGAIQVPYSIPETQEAITATSSNQVSTIIGQPGDVWEIQTITSDVEAVFGSAPDASSGAARRKLTAGQLYYFGVTVTNEKCAVILA